VIKSFDSLDEDQLFEIISELDLTKLLEACFTLFGAKWELDVSHYFRKIEQEYLSDKPLNNYISCLNEAHEQMLLEI
jgi:hypothetical protein